MTIKGKWFVLLLLPLLVFTLQAFEEEEDINKGRQGPMNPAFFRTIQAIEDGTFEPISDDGYFLGEYPMPEDTSRIKNLVKTSLEPGLDTSYPTSFDLRTQNKLTSVRNQGGCGSCWSFATYSSMESCGKPGNDWNFSEQDLIDNHGFDASPCAGGNHSMSSAYLTRRAGPVSEVDVPYLYGDGAAVQRHVQQIFWLPERNDSLDNDTIKYFVTNYGAVHVSYYHSSTYMDATDQNYYNNVNTNTNHAVAVVGWDDNYNASNFKTTPPGNGAFIIRNSWGTGRHDNGYFYLSYYDTSFIPRACYSDTEPVTNYERIYQHDPLGRCTTWGYNTTVAWGANVFTAADTKPLRAVGFYTVDVNTSYDIYIYTGVTSGNPRSGTLAASQSGSQTYPGFYTVTLNTPVSLTNGQAFSVVIRFQNASPGHPLATEYVFGGYSSAVTASANESYISSSGSSWADHGVANGGNFCIKAYASNTGGETSNPDINGDGKVDILWRHYLAGSGRNVVWYMDGVSRTGVATLPRLNDVNWHIVGTGDFNGDGKPDFLWRYTAAGINQGKNAVWYMDGAGRTGVAMLPTLSSLDWEIVGTADFNSDGHRDILWRCTTACATQGQNVVWYMNGVTRTGAAYLPRLNNLNWSIVATGDFNSDGKPDILWRYTTDDVSRGQNVVWYMNGISRTGVAMLPRLTDLEWKIEDCADFNGDGKTDILWRNQGQSVNQGKNVAWFMNGAARTGVGTLPNCTDLNWKIDN